ncbi:MAG: MoxR family ATPase [Oscillospiraceae bacterium]|jgi:MoxR-like ATPase|nr:MoxR family ATPase [Oscillospiraceae bacterium]
MNETISRLVGNIEKAVIGKTDTVLLIVGALLCGGHVLIEDVPGVGRTQLVIALARSVGGRFNRLQLTPDVMPSDVVGFTMPNPVTKEFEYRPGAAMCNFLLADEINRASPKVQSSLLEVMEERQISVDAQTRPVPRPFMTLATQNPVEAYGTYPLPEAQIDRFLIRVSLGYLEPRAETLLLERGGPYGGAEELPAVLSPEEVLRLQEEAGKITIHEGIKRYIVEIAGATRNSGDIRLGASPRGSIGLCHMAKAAAFIKGRTFVTPDDVIELAVPVLAHRLILSQRGKSVHKTQEAAVEYFLGQIPVP